MKIMLIAPDSKLAEVTFKDGVLVKRLDPHSILRVSENVILSEEREAHIEAFGITPKMPRLKINVLRHGPVEVDDLAG